MKKLLFPLLLLIGFFAFGFSQTENSNVSKKETNIMTTKHNNIKTTQNNTDDILKQAYQNQQNNIQIEGSGRVKKILADDNEGSRHQRFILELNSGQTLLIAHNIDLAPKIELLQTGDIVEFYGEYEYSKQGGVIHWTHHDPRREHVGGWLKHNNRIYH